MYRITSSLLICILSSVVFAACSRSETQDPTPPAVSASGSPDASKSDGAPADVVQASAAEVELTPGGKAEAAVAVKIAEGYHINGNPSSKFQIATTLIVDATDGISAGEANYPPAQSKKFSFSPDMIMVYESQVVIKQPLQANAVSAKGSRSLNAKLRVQPCDDKVCYPPRDLAVSIPINVK